MRSLRTAKAGNWEEVASGVLKFEAKLKFGNWLDRHAAIREAQGQFVKEGKDFPESTECRKCEATWKLRGMQAAEQDDSCPVTIYKSFKLDYDVYIGEGRNSTPANYRGSVGRMNHMNAARILQPASSRLEIMTLIENTSVPAFEYTAETLANLNYGDDGDDEEVGGYNKEMDRWYDSRPVGNGQFKTRMFESANGGMPLSSNDDIRAHLKDRKGRECLVAWNMRTTDNDGEKEVFLLEYSIETVAASLTDDHINLDGNGGNGMIVCGEIAGKMLAGHHRRILEPLLSRHHSTHTMILGEPEEKTWKDRLSGLDFKWSHNERENMDEYSLERKSPLD